MIKNHIISNYCSILVSIDNVEVISYPTFVLALGPQAADDASESISADQSTDVAHRLRPTLVVFTRHA